jgi:hypothetical protein
MIGFPILGGMLVVLQVFCHAKIFLTIMRHNESVAAHILTANSLKRRKMSNSIGLASQIAIWILQIWFIAFALVIRLYDKQISSEITSIVKMAEFCLIPIIQIVTTPSLRKNVS